MSDQDQKYMQTALKLARRGIGSVEPNPAVGCIIVKGNQIAGKGWHKKIGGPHAEINALEDCRDLGVNPNDATMYVTLEPCCHQGQTPACTDAIIEAGIAKVYVATIDPSLHNNGAGIEKLRSAGIEVQIGLCEIEARLLNAPFIKYASTGKCWITIKWAQTIDGKLAWTQTAEDRRWISNELSRADAHKLRTRAQAILVGINTVLADDPLLTPRPSKGKKPTRIILDSNLRIPLDCQLIKTAKKSPVLILTTQQAVQQNPKTAEMLSKKGAELLVTSETSGASNLHFLIDKLSERGITQLLVEGGPTVITSFLKADLADELCIYIAPKILASQGTASITESMAELNNAFDLNYTNVETFGQDIKITGYSRAALDKITVNID